MDTDSMASHLQEQYQGYAKALALKLYTSLSIAVELDDVLADANLGLVEAASNYDSAAGASFETYAYYRIRGAIYDGIRKSTWLPPAARASAAVFEASNDVLARNAHDMQRSQDLEELTRQFNESIRLLGAVYTISQMRRHWSDEPNNTLEVEDASAAHIGHSVEHAEVLDRVQAAIAELPGDQRRLIQRIYFKQLAMSEVALELGVHKSTVTRQHQTAVNALRESLVTVAT